MALDSIPIQVEDKLLEVVRQIETGVEGAMGQVMPSMPGSQPSSQEVCNYSDCASSQPSCSTGNLY